MGIGDKVKDIAHKMGVGNTGPLESQGAPGIGDIGSSYTNTGATYGAAGAPGIASPVAPGGPLGEGVHGTETRSQAAEVPMGATTTGTSCDTQYFTKTEDRPIVKERVEYVQEHRPVEKEFVVETRATGAEREVAEGRAVENLGTTERVVGSVPPREYQ